MNRPNQARERGRERKDLIAAGSDYLARTQVEPVPAASVLDLEFLVLPGVFNPAYYPETAFYTRHVRDHLRRGFRYLDLGCGAGATAVHAACIGARVDALDINPAALKNTDLNARLHGVEHLIQTVRSDVFDGLDPNERYDVIYWNVPFHYRAADVQLDPLEHAIFDPGLNKARRFLEGLSGHLAPGGSALMGVSPTLGDIDAIMHHAANVGLDLEFVDEIIENTDGPVRPRIQLLEVVPALTPDGSHLR